MEIAIKYQGYIEHQQEEIEKQKRHENTAIPANFDYSKVSGLSNEVRAKLEQHRPVYSGEFEKTRYAKTRRIMFRNEKCG